MKTKEFKTADNSLKGFKINLQLHADEPAGVAPVPEPVAAPVTAPVAASIPEPVATPTTAEPAQPVNTGDSNFLLDYFKANPGASRFTNMGNQAPAQPVTTSDPVQPVVQPGTAPQPTDQQVTQGAESVIPDWVPEKFKANPENLAKSYTELERKLTEMGTANKAVMQQLQNAGFQLVQGADGQPVVIPVNPQLAQGQAQQPQQPQAPEPAPGLTEEQMRELNEKIADAMLDPEKEPAKVLMDLVSKVVEMQNANLQKDVSGLIQQAQAASAAQQWQNTVATFAEQTSDFETYADEVVKVINEHGAYLKSLPTNEEAIKTAYDLAKARVLANAQPEPAPTKEQLMSDPNFLAEIAQNPEVQKMILQQTATQIQQGTSNIPVMMGNQPAGVAAPTMPADVPTNSKERVSAVKSILNKWLGGGQV